MNLEYGQEVLFNGMRLIVISSEPFCSIGSLWVRATNLCQTEEYVIPAKRQEG